MVSDKMLKLFNNIVTNIWTNLNTLSGDLLDNIHNKYLDFMSFGFSEKDFKFYQFFLSTYMYDRKISKT